MNRNVERSREVESNDLSFQKSAGDLGVVRPDGTVLVKDGNRQILLMVGRKRDDRQFRPWQPQEVYYQDQTPEKGFEPRRDSPMGLLRRFRETTLDADSKRIHFSDVRSRSTSRINHGAFENPGSLGAPGFRVGPVVQTEERARRLALGDLARTSQAVEEGSVELAESSPNDSEFRLKLKKVKTETTSSQNIEIPVRDSAEVNKIDISEKSRISTGSQSSKKQDPLLKIEEVLEFNCPFPRTSISRFKSLRCRSRVSIRPKLLKFESFLGSVMLFETPTQSKVSGLLNLDKKALSVLFKKVGFVNGGWAVRELDSKSAGNSHRFRGLTMKLNHAQMELFCLNAIVQNLKAKFNEFLPANGESMEGLSHVDHMHLFTLYYFGKHTYDLKFDSLLRKYSTLEIFQRSVRKYLGKHFQLLKFLSKPLNWRDIWTDPLLGSQNLETLAESPLIVREINDYLLTTLEQLAALGRYADVVSLRSEEESRSKSAGTQILTSLASRNSEIIEQVLETWNEEIVSSVSSDIVPSQRFVLDKLASSDISDKCRMLISPYDMYDSFLHTFVVFNSYFGLPDRAESRFSIFWLKFCFG